MSKKILIADDEPMVLNQLKLRLVAEGFQVIQASDGAEAVQKARSERPDLIILDILMPGMDGVDAATALKDHAETKDIPLIFLTAIQTKAGEREQGHMMGKNLIFAKPFDGKELVDNIRKSIRG